MAKKTNKTSHVLNLITNGNASEPEETGDEKPGGAESGETDGKDSGGRDTGNKTGAARETAVKSARTKGADSDAASDRESAAEEPAHKEPALKEPASRITSSGDKTVIVVDESSQKEHISSKILDRLTDHLEEEIQSKVETYRMVNVMEQILNRQNLLTYMKQYEVCLCSRCQADVLALILTRLPAKYVVVGESSTAPIIGFYESKFRVRILTEIIKACMDVKEHPRHERSGPYDK